MYKIFCVAVIVVFLSFLGVVVGMEEVLVEVSEGAGDLQLCVVVTSGELVRELIITVIYWSGDAVGMITYMHTIAN